MDDRQVAIRGVDAAERSRIATFSPSTKPMSLSPWRNPRIRFADSAYRSAEIEAKLRASAYNSRIHRRGRRNHPLSLAQVRVNHVKSRIRARIEHVFGAQQNAPGGRIVRTIGIVPAHAKIGLQNLAYNIRRLVTLERFAAA